MTSEFEPKPGKQYFKCEARVPTGLVSMSVFPPACPSFEPLNCHQKGQKGAGSHRACLPRSQTSRQAVVHSPLVTGCSFLAWVLEGGQGAVRLHGNLGTEPWRLPGHEVGFWHQERGSSYLAQNHLYRDPTPSALQGRQV